MLREVSRRIAVQAMAASPVALSEAASLAAMISKIEAAPAITRMMTGKEVVDWLAMDLIKFGPATDLPQATLLPLGRRVVEMMTQVPIAELNVLDGQTVRNIFVDSVSRLQTQYLNSGKVRVNSKVKKSQQDWYLPETLRRRRQLLRALAARLPFHQKHKIDTQLLTAVSAEAFR